MPIPRLPRLFTEKTSLPQNIMNSETTTIQTLIIIILISRAFSLILSASSDPKSAREAIDRPIKITKVHKLIKVLEDARFMVYEDEER